MARWRVAKLVDNWVAFEPDTTDHKYQEFPTWEEAHNYALTWAFPDDGLIAELNSFVMELYADADFAIEFGKHEEANRLNDTAAIITKSIQALLDWNKVE